jgi:hypothetical protein
MTRSRAAPATPAPTSVLEIRNRIAMAGWLFMAAWFGMLLAFTWVMGRDGPHPSQPAELQHGALALFWLFGIGGGAQLLSQPCTRLAIAPDGSARLTRWTLFGRTVEVFPPGAVAGIEIRHDRDSDGDPYLRLMMVAADGSERQVKEGRDPDELRELAAKLRRALGLA